MTTSSQNEPQTRLSELTNFLPTRYNKIADYFKKKDTLDLSLAEEIRRLAEDIEEIMVLKGQPEQVNTVYSTIIRSFKDNKNVKLTKSQETWIWRVLDPMGKYTMNNCYSRSLAITGNLPEENSIQFAQVKEALQTLKKASVNPERFSRDQLKHISEQTIDRKDEMISMCRTFKIAVLDSDVSQSSLWESADNDKYTQKIQTDRSDSRPNSVQEFWIKFGKLCFEIAEECKDFPPMIMQREEEIANALNSYLEFFIPGKDAKFKRHWSDWFEIGKKIDETSINNAANKSPAFSCLCEKCLEPDWLQDPTGTLGLKRNIRMKAVSIGIGKDNHIHWQWVCPKCGNTEMAKRTMTKERVGDMLPILLEYAQRIISDMPLASEFMDWFNEWRLPKITAQTLNLSPKLEEKC